MPLLIAMTVTGRVRLTPAEPLDVPLGVAFNAHQRRDGRLGPDAVAAAVDALGGEVLVRPSPWRLGAAHAELMAAWFGGWVDAACEQEPALAAEAGAYASGGWRRRPPASSPSPSTTPTCWCCRDDATGRAAPRGRGHLAAAATLGVLVWRVGPARSSTACARSTAARSRPRRASRC